MSKIKAGQHVYASVEKEQSPRGKGGFQTLFYTLEALTEDESEEMEARLLYFPSDMEPVKRIFFTTSTGKNVVAQIIPLPEVDRVGRKGRYLAHSLVFIPDDFAVIQANPFAVFSHFAFATTVADARSLGNFQTRDIPAVVFDIPSDLTDVGTAAAWSLQDLVKLTLLALRAERLTRDRTPVTFIGDPQEIESALQAALFAVPTPLRPRFTFDNYFYKTFDVK